MYGPEFDRKQWRLTAPPHVDVFCGLVFANWDEDAASLRDTLGAMAWYMEVVFGKCDMEAVGPPARLRSEQNWKSGAENFSGDGYHIPSTHQTMLDFGMLAPDPIFAQQAQAGRIGTPDPELEPFSMVEFTSKEGGHAGLIQKLPVRYNEPMFLGFEEHLWPEFTKRLAPEQVDLADRLFTMVANVFPNFSFIQQVFPYLGDDTPPVATIHMRVWVPISTDCTEVLFFVLVPKEAGAQWKRASQAAFTRSFGIGGGLETDDYQNWTGICQVNSGRSGKAQNSDYQGNPAHEPTKDLPWPGNVYLAPLTDVTFRAMYHEWDRLMAKPFAANGSRASEEAAVQVVNGSAGA
jgi:phenylpropionate dioxygenase-like ring-hydroxylating dioxygenase large terminal subunit